MGDSHVGLQARLMSQALRKLTAIVAKSRTCLIFINQIREKIGVMFGNPETTTGGRALKFYSSVRIDIRRIASLKDGDEVVGSRAKVKVVKNKVAAPFRQAEFDIDYGEGISRPGELVDLGVEHKDRRQERRLVQLRRPAPRPGARERQAVPARQPGSRRRARAEVAREARPAGRPGARQLAAGRRGVGRSRRDERQGASQGLLSPCDGRPCSASWREPVSSPLPPAPRARASPSPPTGPASPAASCTWT